MMHHSGSKKDLKEAMFICYEAKSECEAAYKECEDETECTKYRVNVADIRISEEIRKLRRDSRAFCTKANGGEEAAEAKEYGKVHVQKRKAAARTAKAAEKLVGISSSSMEASRAELEDLVRQHRNRNGRGGQIRQ